MFRFSFKWLLLFTVLGLPALAQAQASSQAAQAPVTQAQIAALQQAVQNAQSFLAVQKEFGSFDRYIWQFVGGKPLQSRLRRHDQLPARTEQSDAMSKDLMKRGFKFVGSTICYAFMQATGMVNDHLIACFRYKELS